MFSSLHLFVSLLIGASAAASGVEINAPIATTTTPSVVVSTAVSRPLVGVPDVPFYSQFQDIDRTSWQKVGCGVTSLAMIIDFYHPRERGVRVSVDALLNEGVAAGAYITGAGWSHLGLVRLGERYGLEGKTYDLSKIDSASAFARFEAVLASGPVIASVHYKFDPQSTIPHLVVITGIADGRVFYNDPAGKTSGQSLTTEDFRKAWKKRFIALRPHGDVNLL